MKLTIYRICLLVLQCIFAIVGIIAAVSVPLNWGKGGDDMMLMIYLFALVVGLCLSAAFIYYTARSFKKGTILIDQLAFHHDTKKPRKGLLVVFTILFLAFLALMIVGILLICGVFALSTSELYMSTDGWFFVYVGGMLGTGSLSVIVYAILFRHDTIFQKTY